MTKHIPEAKKDRMVGIFMSLGILLLLVSIIILGGSENFFSKSRRFKAKLSNAAGVMVGSKVMFSGVPAGALVDVKYDPEFRGIAIEIEIQEKFASFLREGSTVEVLTQGVLGDKYLAVEPGSGEQIIPDGSFIPTRESKDFLGIVSKSDELIGNVNQLSLKLSRLLDSLDKGNRVPQILGSIQKTSSNVEKLSQELNELKLKSVTHELHSILEKLNRGTGSLGALINDPSLYEDAKALMGGANRNRILRNVVRSTANDSTEKAPPQAR